MNEFRSRSAHAGSARACAAGAIPLLAAVFCASSAAAAAYPDRPIRFVVPQPPGGGTDFVARLLVPKLTENLKQQVIVDNRGGAGGIVGTEIVARSAPDGYTLLLGYTGSLTINPSLHRQLPYRPVEDFDPVSLAVASPFVLLVHPSVRAGTVRELVALAKATPALLNYGSPGNGSLHHLAMEWLASATGMRLTHVPYKGSQQLVALAAGEVSVGFVSVITSMPHVRSGRLRALAVTSRGRSRLLPDIPTVAEAAVPDFEARNWFGVLAPRGTPVPIIERLSALIAAHMNAPETKERLQGDGAESIGSTPEAFSRLIAAELKRWKEVVKLSGAKPG